MGQMAHLRNYANEAGCEVVAIAELKENQGKLVAEHYRIPKVYKSAEEMLAVEKLDGIVASQPFTRHGQLLPELLKAKVPVFTEKPLAGSIEVGEKIVEAVKASGTWYMVGYHKRSDPATMYAKAEIDRLKESGELGALRYVRLLMPAGDWVANGFIGMIAGGDPAPELTWDPPASDMDTETNNAYGAFVNYYIHQVNLMRHLLGEPYHATYAEKSGVLFAGESDSGVACVIEMTPYQTTIDWQESALVAFQHGFVKLELPAPVALNRPGKVEIYKDPGGGVTPMLSSPTLPWIHAMRQQAINFIGAIKGDNKPLCEAAEALEDLKVARQYIKLQKGV
jgi:predicted dehydrogenase